MAEDMAEQVDAIFQPKTKVYCGNCFYYVPARVTKYGLQEARCRHANARYLHETFEGVQSLSIPPETRNARNDCQDWTRRTFFSDLDHNPLKLLMVVLAALWLIVMAVKVLVR